MQGLEYTILDCEKLRELGIKLFDCGWLFIVSANSASGFLFLIDTSLSLILLLDLSFFLFRCYSK